MDLKVPKKNMIKVLSILKVPQPQQTSSQNFLKPHSLKVMKSQRPQEPFMCLGPAQALTLEQVLV